MAKQVKAKTMDAEPVRRKAIRYPVSWCSSIYRAPAKEVDVIDWLESNIHEQDVLAFRKGLVEKDYLPCITPGGVFEGSKQTADLVTPSGVLFIDIDAKDNDMKLVAKKLQVKPDWLLAMTVSARGKGASLFIKVDMSLHGSTTKGYRNLYRAYYQQMENTFTELGIHIDRSCKNINRLRYASYDPKPFINRYAVNLPLWLTPERASSNTKSNLSDSSLAIEVKKRYASIVKAKVDVTETYNLWIFAAGMFNVLFGGKTGQDMFVKLSSFYPGYNPSECIKKYEECTTFDKAAVGAFFRISSYYINKAKPKSQDNGKDVSIDHNKEKGTKPTTDRNKRGGAKPKTKGGNVSRKARS